jgi:hypothetical protein
MGRQRRPEQEKVTYEKFKHCINSNLIRDKLGSLLAFAAYISVHHPDARCPFASNGDFTR